MKLKKKARSQAGIPSQLLGETESTRMYPEIYFKLHPDILLACDEMVKQASRKPTPEIVEQMTDRVYNSVCGKYPVLAKYAQEYEANALSSPLSLSLFGLEIKVRGLFKGLIAFLLLAELFRRRRWRR